MIPPHNSSLSPRFTQFLSSFPTPLSPFFFIFFSCLFFRLPTHHPNTLPPQSLSFFFTFFFSPWCTQYASLQSNLFFFFFFRSHAVSQSRFSFFSSFVLTASAKFSFFLRSLPLDALSLLSIRCCAAYHSRPIMLNGFHGLCRVTRETCRAVSRLGIRPVNVNGSCLGLL
jgi:hypothetical protein